MYNTLSKHSVRVVIGDKNAKLKQDEGSISSIIGRESLHSTSNDNKQDL